MKAASWSAECIRHLPPLPSLACVFIILAIPSAKLTLYLPCDSVSATLAFLVDLRTRRVSTRRGTYDPMFDEKSSFPAAAAATTAPILSPDPYRNRGDSHEVSRPYKVQRPFEAEHFGYRAPSEQTTYEGRAGVERL